jgi:hypothetical protein
MLRSPAQDVESLLRCDALALHEDPLGLADQLTSDGGQAQVLRSADLLLVVKAPESRSGL